MPDWKGQIENEGLYKRTEVVPDCTKSAQASQQSPSEPRPPSILEANHRTPDPPQSPAILRVPGAGGANDSMPRRGHAKPRCLFLVTALAYTVQFVRDRPRLPVTRGGRLTASRRSAGAGGATFTSGHFDCWWSWLSGRRTYCAWCGGVDLGLDVADEDLLLYSDVLAEDPVVLYTLSPPSPVAGNCGPAGSARVPVPAVLWWGRGEPCAMTLELSGDWLDSSEGGHSQGPRQGAPFPSGHLDSVLVKPGSRRQCTTTTTKSTNKSSPPIYDSSELFVRGSRPPACYLALDHTPPGKGYALSRTGCCLDRVDALAFLFIPASVISFESEQPRRLPLLPPRNSLASPISGSRSRRRHGHQDGGGGRSWLPVALTRSLTTKVPGLPFLTNLLIARVRAAYPGRL